METTKADAERVEEYKGRLAETFGRINRLRGELFALWGEGTDLEGDVRDGLADELADMTCHIQLALDAVSLAWNIWDTHLPG